MFVLVPALLTDEKSEQRLLQTLHRIPVDAGATLVLISQQNRLKLSHIPGIRTVIHQHFDQPLGKWTAVRCGLSLIDSLRDSVLLIDADDPFSQASVIHACALARSPKIDYVIGDRRKILLQAPDQLSAMTRVFVEILSNTLLLLALQSQRAIPGSGPDIQSGMYVLSGRARRVLSLEYVTDYGGELALYFELISAGFEPSLLPIEANEVTRSSYSVSRIVRNILELPFLQALSCERIGEALNLACRLYERFLGPGDEARLRLEIAETLGAVAPHLIASDRKTR